MDGGKATTQPSVKVLKGLHSAAFRNTWYS